MVCKSCGDSQAIEPGTEVRDTEVVGVIRGNQITKSDVRTFGSFVGLAVAFIVWASGDD